MENTSNPINNQKRAQNIQILRILSCVGVFFVHFGQRLPILGEARKFTDFGSNGVYMFFLISGLVAFLSFANKKMKIKRYYVDRLIRIVPIYYIVILYNFILHTFILNDVPVDIMHLEWLRYFLFLNIVIPGYDNFWTNLCSTWTIPCFVLFYFLFPIFNKCIRNLKTSILVWGIFFGISFVNIPNINLVPLHSLHYFLIGGIIFYIIQEKKEMIFIVVCTAFIIFLGIKTSDWNTYIWILLFSVLLISSMGFEIKNKIIVFTINELDNCSYAIYLIHAVCIELIDMYRNSSLNGVSQSVIYAIGVFGTIFLSIIIHKAFEVPVTKWLKKISRRIS